MPRRTLCNLVTGDELPSDALMARLEHMRARQAPGYNKWDQATMPRWLRHMRNERHVYDDEICEILEKRIREFQLSSKEIEHAAKSLSPPTVQVEPARECLRALESSSRAGKHAEKKVSYDVVSVADIPVTDILGGIADPLPPQDQDQDSPFRHEEHASGLGNGVFRHPGLFQLPCDVCLPFPVQDKPTSEEHLTQIISPFLVQDEPAAEGVQRESAAPVRIWTNTSGAWVPHVCLPEEVQVKTATKEHLSERPSPFPVQDEPAAEELLTESTSPFPVQDASNRLEKAMGPATGSPDACTASAAGLASLGEAPRVGLQVENRHVIPCIASALTDRLAGPSRAESGMMNETAVIDLPTLISAPLSFKSAVAVSWSQPLATGKTMELVTVRGSSTTDAGNSSLHLDAGEGSKGVTAAGPGNAVWTCCAVTEGVDTAEGTGRVTVAGPDTMAIWAPLLLKAVLLWGLLCRLVEPLPPPPMTGVMGLLLPP